MLIFFRIIAFLEGSSYILLMIGSLVKATTGNDMYVKLLGMPHGILFMAYVVLALVLQRTYKWDGKTLGLILLGSILPFGTFYVDRKYLNPLT